MAKLKVYKEPKLISVAEVQIGQVLEALSYSWASATNPKGEPTYENPTGVFGYIMGITQKDEGRFRQGSIIIERIIPYGENYGAERLILQQWAPEGKNVYLAIGEILYLECLEYKLSQASKNLVDLLGSRSAVPSEEEKAEIREALFDFSTKRKGKPYIFKPKELRPYSLNEILLSLEQK